MKEVGEGVMGVAVVADGMAGLEATTSNGFVDSVGSDREVDGIMKSSVELNKHGEVLPNANTERNRLNKKQPRNR